MYGWRARIGHVAPSRGDTLVYEFYRMLPEGFMMLNTTGTVRQLVDDDFEKQLERIEEAVDIAVLAQFLELAYDGMVLHLAMGRPLADLGRVLDLVETGVRKQ